MPATRCRRAVTFVPAFLATTTFIWLVSLLSLHLTSTNSPERVHRLVIPAGTATRIAAGANALALPSTMGFATGDILELVNQDEAPHAIGAWRVAPHGMLTVRFSKPTSSSFFCSIHPSGTLDIQVRARGVDLSSTILPTLTLGPGLAVVLFVVRRIIRSLDDGG